MKNDINENKALSQTSVSGSLSKNQMKNFVRIFIGSMALYTDFGLDEVKGIEEETINNFKEMLNHTHIQGFSKTAWARKKRDLTSVI